MPRFYRNVFKTIENYSIVPLDYCYALCWQVKGLLVHNLPVSRVSPPTKPLRILLIPGIYETWYFLNPIAQLLGRHGYPVHAVKQLGYNQGSIEDMAEVVQAYISQSAAGKYVIVAHSKGGLIGAHLLSNGGHNIVGMIAINTPFKGSIYAQLLPLAMLKPFIPDNRLLLQLAANPGVLKRIVSIFASFDPHIPAGSALLGAHNIQLSVKGHFRPLNHPDLHQALLDAIRRFESEQGYDGEPAGQQQK